MKTQGDDTSLVATLPTPALGDFPLGSVESRAAARALLGKRQREAEMEGELERCRKGCKDSRGAFIPAPLYWLWTHTETFDEHWKEKDTQPYGRFPDLPYLPRLFSLFLSEARLFVPKSREMLVTWSLMAFAVWKCQFFERSRVVIQTQKEDKVIDLIKGAVVPGYARTLYERQPEWLKERFPLAAPVKDMQSTRIGWENGSVVQGIPKGADQVRQYHPTVLIFDEAAHLDEFKASYAAADPVCSQIIAVSSAGPGWFGELVQGGKL